VPDSPCLITPARRRGPEAEEVRPARLPAAGAARFRHAEQDGRAPQEDQHSGDEDRPAGQHVPGHREQRPGQQEREPRAGAHDAGQPDQADDGDQRPRSDPPAQHAAPAPANPPPRRDARRAGRRTPHHRHLPVPPWSHRYLVRLAATPRVPIVRLCARQADAALAAGRLAPHPVAASSRRRRAVPRIAPYAPLRMGRCAVGHALTGPMCHRPIGAGLPPIGAGLADA
jgi:hypothetical protein